MPFSGLSHDCLLNGYETPAALGFFFVVPDKTLRNTPVLVAKISNHRRHDQPVFQFYVSDLDRFKEFFKQFNHIPDPVMPDYEY